MFQGVGGGVWDDFRVRGARNFGGGGVGLLLWISNGCGVILGWIGRGRKGKGLLEVG